MAKKVQIDLSLSLTDVSVDQATISAKITKIENNKETDISTSELKFYSWAYNLESLKNSDTLVNKIQVDKSQFKFSLNNLVPGNLYRLKVTATETDSDTEFSSPWLMLMTTSEHVVNDIKKEFKFSHNRCKIFIKIKDVFKRAIIYK